MRVEPVVFRSRPAPDPVKVEAALDGRVPPHEVPPEALGLKSLKAGLKQGDGLFVEDQPITPQQAVHRLAAMPSQRFVVRMNGVDTAVDDWSGVMSSYNEAAQTPSIPLATHFEKGTAVRCDAAGVDHFDTFQALDRWCFQYPYPADVLRYYMTRPNTETAVAMAPDGAVGYFILGRDRFQPGTSNLEIIGVTPQAQGKKVGEWLFQEVLSRARAAGSSACYLEVDVNNAGAIKLYEKYGFSIAERVKDCFAPGRDAYRMRLADLQSTDRSL